MARRWLDPVNVGAVAFLVIAVVWTMWDATPPENLLPDDPAAEAAAEVAQEQAQDAPGGQKIPVLRMDLSQANVADVEAWRDSVRAVQMAGRYLVMELDYEGRVVTITGLVDDATDLVASQLVLRDVTVQGL